MCKDADRDFCRNWCRDSCKDWCKDVTFVTAITRPASLHVGPSDSQAETVDGIIFFDCRGGGRDGRWTGEGRVGGVGWSARRGVEGSEWGGGGEGWCVGLGKETGAAWGVGGNGGGVGGGWRRGHIFLGLNYS